MEPMIYFSFSLLLLLLFCLLLQSLVPRTSSGPDAPMAQMLGNGPISYKACCFSDHPAKPLAVCSHTLSSRLALLHMSSPHMSPPSSFRRERHNLTHPISRLSSFSSSLSTTFAHSFILRLDRSPWMSF